MHFSRMHTVCCSGISGGVSAKGGGVCQGVSVRGVGCLIGGVCGGLYVQVGVCQGLVKTFPVTPK